MAIELKPCPACGGPPEYAGDAEGTEFWIACGYLRSCRMGGPSRKTMAEAVEAWNDIPRRADIEQLERERDWLAVNLANALIGRDLVEHLDDLGGMSPPDPQTLIAAAKEATCRKC